MSDEYPYYRNGYYNNNRRSYRNDQWAALLSGLIEGGKTYAMSVIEENKKDEADDVYNQATDALYKMIEKYKNPPAPPEVKNNSDSNVRFTGQTGEQNVTADDLAKGIIPPVGTSGTAVLEGDTTAPIRNKVPEIDPSPRVNMNDIYKDFMSYNQKLNRLGAYGKEQSGNLSNYLDMLLQGEDYELKEVNDVLVAVPKSDPSKAFIVYGNPKPTNKQRSPTPLFATTEDGRYYANWYTYDDNNESQYMKEEIDEDTYNFIKSGLMTEEDLLALQGKYKLTGRSGRSGRGGYGRIGKPPEMPTMKGKSDWNAFVDFANLSLTWDEWNGDDAKRDEMTRKYRSSQERLMSLFDMDYDEVNKFMDSLITKSEKEAKALFQEKIEDVNAKKNFLSATESLNIENIQNALNEIQRAYQESAISGDEYAASLYNIFEQVAESGLGGEYLEDLRRKIDEMTAGIEADWEDYMFDGSEERPWVEP